MRLNSFAWPAVIFCGSALAGIGGGGTLVQGMLEAAVGGILSGPASMLGQVLRKLKVPADRVPQTVAALTSAAAFGIAKGFGVSEEWELTFVRIGAQAGMTSAFAHDAGWTSKKVWARDLASTILVGEPASAGDRARVFREKGK